MQKRRFFWFAAIFQKTVIGTTNKGKVSNLAYKTDVFDLIS